MEKLAKRLEDAQRAVDNLVDTILVTEKTEFTIRAFALSAAAGGILKTIRILLDEEAGGPAP